MNPILGLRDRTVYFGYTKGGETERLGNNQKVTGPSDPKSWKSPRVYTVLGKMSKTGLTRRKL